MSSELITICAIAASGLISQLLAMYRERRNRAWNQEDRAAKQAELNAQLALHNQQLEYTLAELRKNTRISQAAYDEASETKTRIDAAMASQSAPAAPADKP